MSLGFILLLLIGFVLLFAFTHVLEELAIERDCARRSRPKQIRPRSEDTITYSGNG
jgi:hypothetical protein